MFRLAGLVLLVLTLLLPRMFLHPVIWLIAMFAGCFFLIWDLSEWEDYLRWQLWKRRARRNIAAGRIMACGWCKDPIVPYNAVAVGTRGDTKEEVVLHAGYHYTLAKRDAFCVTGAVATGYWDGERIVTTGECMAARAMRTGQTQVGGVQGG